MSSFVKNKSLLTTLLILFLIAFASYKYIYKPPKTIEEINIIYTGSSDNFLSKITNEGTSNWINKAIEINGVITSLDTKGIVFNHNIFCQLKEESNLKHLKEGQKITIKGIVIGYDDLLEELKLNQCIIKNN